MKRGAHPKLRAAAKWLAVVALAFEALYLLAGNVLLNSQAVQRMANAQPQMFHLTWDRAFTWWPGQVQVKNLSLSFQDDNVQFQLQLDSARFGVALAPLLDHHFRATHLRAAGVSYRMTHKAPAAAARFDAYPPIEGFGPAVRGTPLPTLKPEQVAALWNIELDDVDASVREVWVLEYRYLGEGHVTGAFALQPLTTLWVGPALLKLGPGELTLGEHRVAGPLELSAAVTFTPFAVPPDLGLELFRTLSASVQLKATLADPGVLATYLPGLHLTGAGTVAADVTVKQGVLAAETTLGVELKGLHGGYQGVAFDADFKLDGSLASGKPGARAFLTGAMTVPVEKTGPITVKLANCSADLGLADADLVAGLSPEFARAALRELTVDDARPIIAIIQPRAPFFVPGILGEGPLTAAIAADLTPSRMVVRLEHAKLGDAALEGAALKTASGWNGAGGGHLGVLFVGLKLKHDAVEVAAFIGPDWLKNELTAIGLQPAGPTVTAR